MYKRLIASIFTFKGKCYQTLSYLNYKPLGSLTNVLEILDKHQVDEIFISNRSQKNYSIDLSLLEEIKSSKILTPIAYSGGINNSKDVIKVLSFGVDRVAINFCLWDKYLTKNIISAIGKQGVIAGLPFKFIDNEIFFFNSRNRTLNKGTQEFLDFIRSLNIEILLIDIIGDGHLVGFNKKAIKIFHNCQIILQGGIIKNLKRFNEKNISGIAIENRLLWKEQAAINLRVNNNYFFERDLKVEKR